MVLTEEIINSFPTLLKERIRNGLFEFPEGTQDDYLPFEAYRVFFREDEDILPVNREDFRSFAELGIEVRGNGNKKPEYYGTSLFKSIKELNNIQSLNKPQKRIAKGLVFSLGGPIKENDFNQHVCWWLYEKVDLSSFKEVKENE